jgi:drug/metabolite transporter (DMT)-like permease
MVRFFPLVFVLLWSSAFVTGKVIVADSSPLAALLFRFSIVTLGFVFYSLFTKQKILYPLAESSKVMATGILFHGIYLGGCWYSFSKGMPAGIVALIVTLQPILTSLLAGPLLGEVVTWRQWVGIFLGFSAGTLWQKKISLNMPLSVSNIYQSFGASIFLLVACYILEQPFIHFTTSFILAMSWTIIAVSFGAFTILMYLIKTGSASQTSALFFLVPSVTAIIGWSFVEEVLTVQDLVGFFVATLGVYVATRKNIVATSKKV